MVQNVCDFLQDINNPFETSTELFNIPSGVVADKAVTADILGAKKKGNDACEKFVEERVVKGVVEFFHPITKNNLKSFRTIVKQVKIKLKNRDSSIKADRSLFARLIVMAQNRSFNMRDVLSYSLGPLPWSIALADGSLVKNNKAKLLQFLEKDMLPLDTVATGATWIIDGMALLQSMKNVPATLKEIANTVLKALMIRNARQIDFVTDRNPDISMKNTERNRITAERSLLAKITGGKQRQPQQWKKFLAHGKNKSTLIEFLLEEWSKDTYAGTIAHRELYVAIDDDCYKLTSENGTVIKELQQDLVTWQEEADTRMFLHASHAGQQGYETIVIKPPDTDVGVLAVYYSSQISGSLMLATGTGNKRRFIDVNGISQ